MVTPPAAGAPQEGERRSVPWAALGPSTMRGVQGLLRKHALNDGITV